MRVASIHLRDFRTYERADAQLGEGLTIVHGPNGAGKSNLLEGLYFGCTGYSPRTSSERELVRFGCQATRVAIELYDEGHAHELAVGLQPGQPKHMCVDGAEVERLADVEQRPLVSVFNPDRLELVKGAPSLRRAHLDQLVRALWPLRRATRREFGRVLAQRNALLSSIRAGRCSRATLPSWDAELARLALALRRDREEAVALLVPPFTALSAALGLEGEASLEYRSRGTADDTQSFIEELQASLERDVQRGFTTHGPHRDELALLRDHLELRSYGSQGEQRLALLALLLAERALLREHRANTPLMLLDDVMSELDAERRELLAGELSTDGQSVVATTDLSHVPGAERADVVRLRVSRGAILTDALAA
jgi:DNA replication and repair protein RecF